MPHLGIASTQSGIFRTTIRSSRLRRRKIAVIPHDRKPGIIAWLRSFDGGASVRLDWHKRGQLTLSHCDVNGHSATLQVPVEIHGNPPVIAFNAR